MFFAVNNFYWQLFLAQLKMTFQKWIKYNSQDKCFLCVNQLVREKHWCTLCVQTLPSSGDWLTETSCGHFGIPLCGGAWFAMPAGEMDTPARHQQLHLADIRRGAVWLLLVEWVAVGWKSCSQCVIKQLWESWKAWTWTGLPCPILGFGATVITPRQTRPRSCFPALYSAHSYTLQQQQ